MTDVELVFQFYDVLVDLRQIGVIAFQRNARIFEMPVNRVVHMEQQGLDEMGTDHELGQVADKLGVDLFGQLITIAASLPAFAIEVF